MTVREVAARLGGLGIMDEDDAQLSLTRCRPGRPPLYRHGEQYHLDPHDDELDLWLFRLGIRPPKVAVEPRPPPVLAPLALAFDPGERRLADLGATQKTWKLNSAAARSGSPPTS